MSSFQQRIPVLAQSKVLPSCPDDWDSTDHMDRSCQAPFATNLENHKVGALPEMGPFPLTPYFLGVGGIYMVETRPMQSRDLGTQVRGPPDKG